jgi:two-component system, cell cycle response regulator
MSSSKDEPRLQLLVERMSDALGRSLRLERRSSALSIEAADGRPLAESERRISTEWLRHAIDSDVEFEALKLRLQLLEKQNADLLLRNRALAEASSVDALTGLYNRRYVMDSMEAEINRAIRSGAPISVLMLDLDHFKSVNDNHGHAAGDLVLRHVGSVLRESCRVYDVPARYGGEEFCLLLPDTPVENSVTVAERIRRRLESKTVDYRDGSSLRITASIGVAALEENDSDKVFGSAALIDRADRALYVAKDRGRNRVVPWRAVESLSPAH